MEIYSFYEAGKLAFSMFFDNYIVVLNVAIIWAVLSFCVIFILQGFGLRAMAKRRNIGKRWMAFTPFVNIYYMGKLAGDCGFFGHKMKNAGLYAMLAQILSVLVACVCIFSEYYLYLNHGVPQYLDELATPYWPALTGFSATVAKFYEYGTLSYSLVGLVSELLLLVLVLGLYKKYTPRNYTVLSLLSLFVPASRFIIIFSIRNREPFDYDAYLRARREEYIRRQQQYGNYGNPYGNPYGNSYNGYGNPYGQGGYAGQNGGRPTPPKEEDPFEEFSSGDNRSDAGQSGSFDDFFN